MEAAEMLNVVFNFKTLLARQPNHLIRAPDLPGRPVSMIDTELSAESNYEICLQRFDHLMKADLHCCADPEIGCPKASTFSPQM
jgi:hypothetical protein